MEVTCGPKGCIHDYVPFYFSKKTSMQLSVINKRDVDQQHLIYFAVSLERIADENVIFSDSSANRVCPPDFYDALSDLEKLDWDIIDSLKWGGFSEQEKQKKMAEMLMYEQCLLSQVDYMVVWNEYVKKKVENIFDEAGLANRPKIICDNEHYYLTFYKQGQSSKMSLVTGPVFLYAKVLETVKLINHEKEIRRFRFHDVNEALYAIEENFCCIRELENIEGIQTGNIYAIEDIGKHSRSVVTVLKSIDEFSELSERNKQIVTLAAYLHDIGKTGVQKEDSEHQLRSLPMLHRIFTEDIGDLKDHEVYTLVTLVVYHDLVAEIVAKGRNCEQFYKVVRAKSDVDMFVAITKADMGAVSLNWNLTFEAKLEQLKFGAYGTLKVT